MAYTEPQIAAAIQKAHDAGDFEAAKELGSFYKQNFISSIPTPTPIDPKEKGTALTRALPRGIDTGQMMLGSSIEGFGSLTGIESLQEYGAGVSERNKAELAAQEAGATRLKDIKEAEGILDTAGETASFTGSALGETLPMSGAVVGGSLIGAKTGAAFGGPAGAAIGTVVGGFAANYPFIYGENVEAQKEAVAQGLKPEVDYATAALYAIPATALDTIATLFTFGLAKLGGGVGKQIMDEALQSGGVFTRGAKNVAAGTVTEVPTEVGQEIISRYQSGQSIDSPEAIDSYVEVAAAAAAVGSSIRGTTGILKGQYVSPEERLARDREVIKKQETLQEQLDEQAKDDARKTETARLESEIAGYEQDLENLKEQELQATEERRGEKNPPKRFRDPRLRKINAERKKINDDLKAAQEKKEQLEEESKASETTAVDTTVDESETTAVDTTVDESETDARFSVDEDQDQDQEETKIDQRYNRPAIDKLKSERGRELRAMELDVLDDPRTPPFARESYDEETRAEGNRDDLQKYYEAQEDAKNSYVALERTQGKDVALDYLAADIHSGSDPISEKDVELKSTELKPSKEERKKLKKDETFRSRKKALSPIERKLEQATANMELTDPTQFGPTVNQENKRPKKATAAEWTEQDEKQKVDIARLKYLPYTGGLYGLDYWNSLTQTDKDAVLKKVRTLRAEELSGARSADRTTGGMTANDYKRLEQLENNPNRTPEEQLDLIELQNRNEINKQDFLEAETIQAEVNARRIETEEQAAQSLTLIEEANNNRNAKANEVLRIREEKIKEEENRRKKEEEKSTPSTVIAALIERFGDITNVVTVVEKPSDIQAELDAAKIKAPSRAKGAYIVKDGVAKVYLFSNNIKRGKEVGVLLHEVGVHAGMQNAVGKGNYQFLIKKVKQFAELNDDSTESNIAKAAMRRLESAKKQQKGMTQQEENDELLAYFVEEAVSTGNINPTEKAKEPTKLGIWFKRFVSGVKSLLRKFRLKNIIDTNFNSQDFVDIAYGAAQKEIREISTSNLQDLIRFSTTGVSIEDADGLFELNDSLSDDPTKLQTVEESIIGSGAGRLVRKVLYDSLSFYQLQDIVRRFNPKLADRIQTLEYIAAKRRKSIDDNRRAFTDAIVLNTRLEEDHKRESGMSKAQIKALKEEFGDIAHLSSIVGVDLRLDETQLQAVIDKFSAEDKAQAQGIINRYNALPEQYKLIYRNMANVYEIAGNRLLVFRQIEIDKLPSSRQKLAQKLTGNRIVPYFPLMRNGSVWIKARKGTEPEETLAYESTRKAKQAARQLRKDGYVITKAPFSRGKQTISKDEASASVYQDVLKMLYEANTPENEQNKALIESVTESYLEMFPSDSLKQQFKKRKGTPGYSNDVFSNFATMGLKLANELAVIETAQDFNNAVGAIEKTRRDEGSGSAAAIDSVMGRVSFLRNPQPKPFAGRLSYLGYNAFLAGNISSAIVNLTQLFIVTFPKLYAEFGLTGAIVEMSKAMGNYIANVSNARTGRDNNTTLTVPGLNWNLADVTIFTEEAMKKDPALRTLYEASLSRGGIRRTTSQELQDARRGEGVYRLGGDLQRAELALNWAFQNSERANREIGIMAAYKLAMKKYNNSDIAIDRALKITEEASGSALAELGPAYFQDGWGKVIGTFKRFVFSQIYLQYKLLRDALGYVFPSGHIPDTSLPIDPATGNRVDARELAVKQLTMITATSFIFAGARGVPLYGVFEMIFDLSQDLDGDEEDFVDTNTFMKSLLGDMAFRGPLSYYLNIDLASRVGFYGLLGRKDARKLEDLGPVYYAIDMAGGPVLAYANNVVRGIGALTDSARKEPVMDGVQMMLPAAIRNGFKAIRFGMDGATNKRGVPIIEDFTAFMVATQAIGFTPATLTDKYEDNNFVSNILRKIREKKTSLLNRRYYAVVAGDVEERRNIDKAIRQFNNSKIVRETRNRIDADAKSKSIQNKRRSDRESVDGLSINPRAARAARDMYNLNNE